MPTPVPTPLAAALGIVPAVIGHVRRLPAKAVQLPIFAVSSALNGLDSARREYEDLAARGERLLARLRGTSFDELEDRVEDSLKGTPLARPYDAVEDALEDVAKVVQRAPAAVRTAPAKARKAAGGTVRAAGETLDRAADAVEDRFADTGGLTSTSAPAATPGATPVKAAKKTVQKATQHAATAVGATAEKLADSASRAADELQATADGVAGQAEKVGTDLIGAAPDEVAERLASAAGAAPVQSGPKTSSAAADLAVELKQAATAPVDEAPKGAPTPKAPHQPTKPSDSAASQSTQQAVEKVVEAVGVDVPAHDDLPLADYDHLTLGSLRGRLRSLDLPQLVQLRSYEKAHADRLPIMTMLDNRIAKLAAEPTTPLSPGGDAAADAAPSRSTGSAKASPATAAPAPNDPVVAHGGLGGTP